jgi:hypothetical protein
MYSTGKLWSKAAFALLLLAVLSINAAPGLAQGLVEKYTLEKISVKYGSIAATKGSTNLGTGDDNLYTTSLPFDFNYDGTAYKQGATVYACTNGYIDFGPSPQPTGSPYDDRVYPNYKYPNSIYPVSGDLVVTGGIYTSTQGSSPNRVFVIEWNSFYGYPSSNYTSMQVRLYETSNVVEFHYQDLGLSFNWSGSNSGTGGAGLHGGTQFTYLRVFGPDKSSMPSTSYRMTPPALSKPQLTSSPKSINFGSYAAGETSPTFDVTVANASTTGTLVIGSTTIGGTADFKIISSPATNSFGPGQSGVYKLAFSPIGSGTRSGTFNIVSNGVDSGSQTINLTGFGVVPQVQYDDITGLFRKTRTRMGEWRTLSTLVRSTGNGPLKITGFNVTGEYASMYTFDHLPPAVMPAGTIDSVVVRYTPTEEGLRTANLNITTNAVTGANKTIMLFGLGILPRLTLTPTAVRFDSVAMGDTAWTTVRLSNMGSDTLAVKADYVTYADRDFAYFGLEGADSLIPPEKFRDVMVRFTPTTRGARQGRVRFLTNIPRTFEAVRRDTSTFIVDVTGTGVPFGLLSIEGGSTLDSAIIGQETCQTVQIWNNGQSPLTINSATIIGSDASDFKITGITYPKTIAPQSHVDVQVCGTPSSRGLRTAMVDVSATSNERMTNTQLPLAVYGLEVCAQSSTNIAFENEIILVRTNTTAQIIINNCGDVATAYTGVVAGTGYALSSDATTAMIAPGDNATFEVTFNPLTMGALPGTLTVTGQGVTPIVVQLAGTGGDVMIVAENTIAPATAVASTSAPFTVTVTNNGNMDLTPGDPSISNSEFAYVAGSGPSTLAAGGSGSYQFTFTPASSGTRTATVTFPLASPSLGTSTGSSFILSGPTTSSVRPVAQNGYALAQNYPNPTAAVTVISFTMATSGNAQIIVSDVTGNVVATAADQYFNAGANSVTFDASKLATGTYFYELIANGIRLQRSMMLSK